AMISVPRGARESLLIKASFVGAFAEAMFLPVYAIFTERVGGSVADAGLGFALLSFANGLFVLIVGSTEWFSRHVKAMVFWGFLISALGDATLLVVGNRYQLFGVQLIVGVALGMMNPAWDSLYSSGGNEDDAAGRWSFWTGGVQIASGLAALAGGLIVAVLGFSALFLAMSGLDLLAAYYSFQVWFSPQQARLREERLPTTIEKLARPFTD